MEQCRGTVESEKTKINYKNHVEIKLNSKILKIMHFKTLLSAPLLFLIFTILTNVFLFKDTLTFSDQRECTPTFISESKKRYELYFTNLNLKNFKILSQENHNLLFPKYLPVK